MECSKEPSLRNQIVRSEPLGLPLGWGGGDFEQTLSEPQSLHLRTWISLAGPEEEGRRAHKASDLDPALSKNSELHSGVSLVCARDHQGQRIHLTSHLTVLLQ